MKTRIAFAFLLAAAGVGAGCYDAGDLGDEPFLCSKQLPECPDGYGCDLPTPDYPKGVSNHCENTGRCVCIRQELLPAALETRPADERPAMSAPLAAPAAEIPTALPAQNLADRLR